ncbi:MAG: FkbM family methyltransferase [Parcubacteria group bacterium Gr01-1014_30]|nr:MAG: FkbM family methyltransferase [Parcubacteria group bacterium Gr01-1014_30]
MRKEKGFYAAKIYQAFRRNLLRGRYLGNSSLPVKIFAEPLIKLLSWRKRMKVFPADPWGTRMRFLLGWWEPETVKVCEEIIKPGMTIVDVGAHVGYYTRIFSELVGKKGKVLAFEPHPATFNFLSFNIPPFSYPNVKLFPLALSDRKETLALFEVKGSGKHSFYDVSSLAERDPQAYEFKKKWKVKAEILDEILDEHEIQNVDFMKVDVEGAELRVLKGAEKTIRQSANIQLIVEFNIGTLSLAGVLPEEFIKQLKNLGFRKILGVDDVERKLRPVKELWERAQAGYIDLLCSKS